MNTTEGRAHSRRQRSPKPRSRRPSLIEWAVVSVLGVLTIGFTAFKPVRVTAGDYDQANYHWPTIEKLAGELPTPDLVDMQTATGPVYHLIAAVFVRLFGFTEATTQFVMGVGVWAALAAVLVVALRQLDALPRYLVFVTVFAGAYIVEATFWMTTDGLTVVLGTAVLAIAYEHRRDLPRVPTIWIAVLMALAVGTRQTAVWLIPVALVVLYFSAGPLTAKLARAAVLVVPSAVVLMYLVVIWRGFVPPQLAAENASGPEPLGLPVGFALWAFFAVPLLWAIWDQVQLRGRMLVGAVASAIVCAAPAVIWTSSYAYPNREGGWLWKLIKAGGAIGDRSPVLIVLALIGGAAVFAVLHTLHSVAQRSAWLLGVAIYGSILVAMASSRAYPKYREIPLLTCFPILVLAIALTLPLASRGSKSLTLVLCVPAGLQLLATAAIVGSPYLQFLIDPVSVQPQDSGGEVRPG